MAYDAHDGYVVLFGGSATGGSLMNDTWTFRGGTWTHLSTPVAPSPRAMATMVYDTHDAEILLFGGCTAVSGPGECLITSSGASDSNQTWAFVGGTWTLLHPATSPSARGLAAMAYDPSLQAVVLGGGWNGGNVSDMWTFKAGAWTSVSTLPGQPFHGRYASLGFDANGSGLIYFGGHGFSYNETWRYSSGSWAKLTPAAAPPMGSQNALAFDPALHELVLFGGDAAPSSGGEFGQTWSFHAGNWTHHPLATHPSSRALSGMAYDAHDGYLLLFGGLSGTSTALGGTWIYR